MIIAKMNENGVNSYNHMCDGLEYHNNRNFIGSCEVIGVSIINTDIDRNYHMYMTAEVDDPELRHTSCGMTKLYRIRYCPFCGENLLDEQRSEHPMNRYYIVFNDGNSSHIMAINENDARWQACNRYSKNQADIKECRLII